MIGAVDPTSDAAGKLQRGDVIQSVNSTPVRTAADVAARGRRGQGGAGARRCCCWSSAARGQARFLPVKLKG